jgi:DNA-binding response OmpR family regulator
MSEVKRILIIEDDPSVGSVLKFRLKEAGYDPSLEDHGTAGYENARSGEYAAIILDVMLPGMDGFDILQKLREERVRSKVLMLSAKTEFDSRVKGLENGADDYISKPFDHREVILRLRKMLSHDATAEILTIGDVTLDRLKRVVERAGRTEALTDREFSLLEHLMVNAGEIVSKEDLLKEVWKSDFQRDPSVVNVYLSYLRKKLERDDLPALIETVHGAGVRFTSRDS